MKSISTSQIEIEQSDSDLLESRPDQLKVSQSKKITAFDEVFYASENQNCRSDESPEFDLMLPFQHEPLTNFLIDENQSWIEQFIDRWQSANIEPIPLQIDGDFVKSSRSGMGKDPSRPDLTVAYRFAISDHDHVASALNAAVRAGKAWDETPLDQRRILLIEAAHKLAKHRGHLIGVSLLDAGKTIEQADAEVSTAIDIANYYARLSNTLEPSEQGVSITPHGVVLVVPPRNMPLGVTAGNILAAILAGNSVILKPSLETVLLAWELSKALWEAGIPKPVLQFLPTLDDEVGQALVSDERINLVVLTGSYETARQFLGWRPDMTLIAETGGKNSMIVTLSADYEMAIADIVYSAFGHNGLKSSASGIAILVQEVYDDPAFMEQLKEAAEALFVGSAWDTRSLVTPLIREPDEVLTRALEELEPWESWLLEPQMVDGNPNLWSPGIKMGIQPGSFYHRHECFGPMLGLMRAENGAHALALANMSEFGLTTSIHSQDSNEIGLALDLIEAGNVYINRNTTHTLVKRQPFGGWKKSSFGICNKAGGPNFLLNFGIWHDNRLDQISDDPRFEASVLANAQDAWQRHFSPVREEMVVRGEKSLFQYKPIRSMVVRVNQPAEVSTWVYRYMVTCADLCGVPLTFSFPESFVPSEEGAKYRFVRERESDLAQRIGSYERVRYLGKPSSILLTAAHEAHVSVIRDGLTLDGRLELRYYLREQTLSRRMLT